VYGHDGKATNVTMEPGDMILYESHSVLHGTLLLEAYFDTLKCTSRLSNSQSYPEIVRQNVGRPFALKGRFMANIFIHFEPNGHSLRHNTKTESGGDVDKKYRDALQRGSGGHESDLPSYVVAGTPEEEHWRQAHPDGVVSTTLNLVFILALPFSHPHANPLI
jgi:prolyl 4-hydroxylase